MFDIEVIIRPKSGILDPQGHAVKNALNTLGLTDIQDARVGKVIHLKVGAASARDAQAMVEQACEKLLANPIIEDYEVVPAK